MPETAQHVFAGMIFQLGRPCFSKFKKSIQYAKEGAWDKCATEILILDGRCKLRTGRRGIRTGLHQLLFQCSFRVKKAFRMQLHHFVEFMH